MYDWFVQGTGFAALTVFILSYQIEPADVSASAHRFGRMDGAQEKTENGKGCAANCFIFGVYVFILIIILTFR